MIKLLAKKFFFDYVDHFYKFLLLNAGFILGIIISLGICSLLQLIMPGTGYTFILIAGFIIIFTVTVYTGAAAGIVYAITENKAAGFREFIHYLKSSFKNSALFSLANFLFLFLLLNAFAFYAGMGKTFGSLAAAVLFWLGLLCFAASQFFFAVHYRLEKKFFKILKKMFILFLDNQLFSIGLFLATILLGLITIPLLLMIPGFLSLHLLIILGLKFRLYKYQYLETIAADKPYAVRRRLKIPWNGLLATDIKNIENRTIRNTFFPGKSRE